MERKLNQILAYLKPKNTPVLDIPTEEATDSKLVTVSYFTYFHYPKWNFEILCH